MVEQLLLSSFGEGSGLPRLVVRREGVDMLGEGDDCVGLVESERPCTAAVEGLVGALASRSEGRQEVFGQTESAQGIVLL